MSQDRSELLFSYGTLQLAEVQMAQFGRLLDGTPDAMPGYGRSMIEITDPEVIRRAAAISTLSWRRRAIPPMRCLGRSSPSPRPS